MKEMIKEKIKILKAELLGVDGKVDYNNTGYGYIKSLGKLEAYTEIYSDMMFKEMKELERTN